MRSRRSKESSGARGTVVLNHDRRCRSVHLAAAGQLGAGWDAYLKGLLSILHYAEHSEANLRDAHGALCNVVSIVTADGRVSSGERKRLIQACAEMHNALRHIYEDEGKVIVLDRTLAAAIEGRELAGGARRLRLAARERTERRRMVERHRQLGVECGVRALGAATQRPRAVAACRKRRWRASCAQSMTPGAAPEATKAPAQYPVLVPRQRAAATEEARSVGSLSRRRWAGSDARAADRGLRNHRRGAERRYDRRRHARQHLQRTWPSCDGVDRRGFDQARAVLTCDAHAGRSGDITRSGPSRTTAS